MEEVGRQGRVTLTVRTRLSLSALAQRSRWMHADAELMHDGFSVLVAEAEVEAAPRRAKESSDFRGGPIT